MLAPTANVSGSVPRKPSGRFRRTGPLMLALAVQVALLVITAFVIVAIPSAKEEPEFIASPTIHLPQKELEHRVALAEFQQATAKPPLMERLMSAALLPDGLPPMPAIDTADFNPIDASASSPDANAMLAQSGLLGFGGSSAGKSAASFFGIEDAGERIVIVVNTSVSVVNKAENRGVSIDRIQEEMIALIGGLQASTLFGIVQFSQGVRAFEDFLAPATRANKEALARWVPANLRGNPRARADETYYGHEAAFEAAFALDPDVIFLLTDGQLNRRTGVSGDYSYPEIPYSTLLGSIGFFQQKAEREVRIHVIGFELKSADATGMRNLTRDFGGQLREF